jgi:hypothetical protein
MPGCVWYNWGAAEAAISREMMNAYRIKVTVRLQMYVVRMPAAMHSLKPDRSNSDTWP